MSFLVSIDNLQLDEFGQPVVPVSFQFGASWERCQMPLDYWTLDDYLYQWTDAVAIVCKLNSKSAIITSIQDPAVARNITAWVAYPDALQQVVHIQQHLLLGHELLVGQRGFDYTVVEDRVTISDDGEPVSEWSIPIDEFCKFSIVRHKAEQIGDTY